jgi:hypothetical protein
MLVVSATARDRARCYTKGTDRVAWEMLGDHGLKCVEKGCANGPACTWVCTHENPRELRVTSFLQQGGLTPLIVAVRLL